MRPILLLCFVAILVSGCGEDKKKDSAPAPAFPEKTKEPPPGKNKTGPGFS